MYSKYCFIQQLLLKFTLLLVLSCDTNSAAHLKNYPNGEILIGKEAISIKTYIAVSEAEQRKGLSDVLEKDFLDNEGLLFTARTDKLRQFWMPRTHFDLDLIFLSEDLYVLDIHRRLKHFNKDGPDHAIPRSKIVRCRHVLEIKSSSPIAQKIYPGMILKWKGSSSLEKIISSTHLER